MSKIETSGDDAVEEWSTRKKTLPSRQNGKEALGSLDWFSSNLFLTVAILTALCACRSDSP